MNDFIPEHIAVMRFTSLGDAVIAAVMMPALRQSYPKTKLTFVTNSNYTHLFSQTKELNNVIGVSIGGSLREELDSFHALWAADFDLIIDLQDKLRSKILKKILVPKMRITYDNQRQERLSWIRGKDYPNRIGLPVTPTWKRYLDTLISLNLDTASVDYTQNLLNIHADAKLANKYRINNSKYICIAFGAKHLTKKWPTKYFADLSSKLTQLNIQVVLVGSQFEYFEGEEIKANNKHIINICGEPLLDQAKLCSGAMLVLSNDSGFAHLAESMGKPVAMLFGSTSPVLGFGPRLPLSQAISLELSCSPCHLHGAKICPLGHFDCMNKLTPDFVLEKLKQQMNIME